MSYTVNITRGGAINLSTAGAGVPGQRGEKGDKGDPGRDGIDGVNGATGNTGAKGDTGATGATGPPSPDALSLAEHLQESIPRPIAMMLPAGTSCQLQSGRFFGMGITARRSVSVSGIRVWTSPATPPATITLARIGLYTVDAAENITLVASTANDTALFKTANTEYAKPLTTPYAVVAGQRYCLGLLVTASGPVEVIGVTTVAYQPAGYKPRINFASQSTALTDLPASLTVAAMGIVDRHFLIAAYD
jgi:hypothetical protein